MKKKKGERKKNDRRGGKREDCGERYRKTV
jgi:hypothetical protein